MKRHFVFILILLSLWLVSCGPNPTKARFHLENAIELIFKAQTEEAIKELNLVLKYDRDSHEALYYRGSCKRQLNDIDGAIQDYQASIEKNPLYDEPYFALGLIYDYLQDSQKACSYYLKAEELGKQNIVDYTKWCK
ncbi:MAG: tetratricopeptide repeat protein [Bacteroidales bacterium]|nr:tetratricopeptide repeat protein [Bacteroidales bacterium]